MLCNLCSPCSCNRTCLYAIPKIKMLCNLRCLKTRLRLLCNKYQLHSSLNLVSRQLKLCNIFIFGMAYWTSRKRDFRISSPSPTAISSSRWNKRNPKFYFYMVFWFLVLSCQLLDMTFRWKIGISRPWLDGFCGGNPELSISIPDSFVILLMRPTQKRRLCMWHEERSEKWKASELFSLQITRNRPRNIYHVESTQEQPGLDQELDPLQRRLV